MPDGIHEIVASPGPVPHRLAVRIDGRPSGFDLGSDPISSRLVADVPPRLLDFLEVAAAVFATDSQVPRGGLARNGMGERWRRRFAFHISVREPEFWSRPEVSGALVDLVGFMSEDVATFEFERAAEPVGMQNYFDFDPSGEAHTCEDVVLFSGGLDSLAGAMDALAETEGRVALVTHFSAQKRMPAQRALAEEMKRRYGDRVLTVPVKARRHRGRRPPETTQRTRSLLFAAIGFTVQRMLGAERFSIHENGIVSQNLPISPQVIGSMASRTTHPRTIQKLRTILELVGGKPVDLRAPYEWLTKREVVERLAMRGGADLIGKTVSCSHIWDREAEVPHCGSCSQCLDRRFAVLAAGLADQDPEEGYAIDVISGVRADDRDHVLAVEWSRNGRDLKDIGEAAFLDRFGREVASTATGFPERPVGEVMAAILDLHRRHGQAIFEALTSTVHRHAEDLVAGRLGDRSLIVAFAREGVLTEAEVRPRTVSPTLGVDEDEGVKPASADIFPLQVRLFRLRDRPAVEIVNLGTASGASFRVVEALQPYHEEDRRAGRSRDDCRYFESGNIARTLDTTKNAVGVSVNRCRRDLAECYFVVTGTDPPGHLLIQSGPRRGYRVDPDARFIAAER